MPSFGRITSPDARDNSYLMNRRLGFAAHAILPTTKTWGIDGHSIDQGDTSTCVGHAWKNFLRCKPYQTDKSGPTPYAIYRRAVQLDAWADNDSEANLPDGDPRMASGTSVRAGAKVLQEATRIESYMWAFLLQDMIEWILTQGPVVVGTNWFSSMMDTDKDGMVRVRRNAEVVGGHAYLVRGANTRSALLTCENSWGDGWGKNGMFYVPFDDFERLLAEDGEACTALETYVHPA
jgi:hypothetical protein